MLTATLGAIGKALFWLIVLPGLAFLVVLPASLYLVAKQSRGGFAAFLLWIGAANLGWVPTFGGPAGLPTLVFWPATGIFALWVAIGAALIGKAAFKHASRANRLMKDYGMPASEII